MCRQGRADGLAVGQRHPDPERRRTCRRLSRGGSQDISGQKTIENRLRRTVEKLERSNIELGRFAEIAAHDLQEPLRIMVSYAHLLARRYKGRFDADADDFMGFIVYSSVRMKSLIQDLLRYSLVERGDPPADPVDTAACPCNPGDHRAERDPIHATDARIEMATQGASSAGRSTADHRGFPQPAGQRIGISGTVDRSPLICIDVRAVRIVLGVHRLRQRHRHRELGISIASSWSSNACIPNVSTPAPELGWRSSRRSSNGMVEPSRLCRSPARAVPSASPCRRLRRMIPPLSTREACRT